MATNVHFFLAILLKQIFFSTNFIQFKYSSAVFSSFLGKVTQKTDADQKANAEGEQKKPKDTQDPSKDGGDEVEPGWF